MHGRVAIVSNLDSRNYIGDWWLPVTISWMLHRVLPKYKSRAKMVDTTADIKRDVAIPS